MPFVTIDLCPLRIDVRTAEDQDAFLRLMDSYRHFENHPALADAGQVLDNLQNSPIGEFSNNLLPANERQTRIPPSVPAAERAAPPVSVRPSMPPVGERSIDYLLRVAIRSEESQHFNALYPQMQALGWKSTSQTSRAILNNLSSICRKHRDLVEVLKECVTLTEAGRAFAQTLAAPEATP